MHAAAWRLLCVWGVRRCRHYMSIYSSRADELDPKTKAEHGREPDRQKRPAA
jgi:hypothetical protein